MKEIIQAVIFRLQQVLWTILTAISLIKDRITYGNDGFEVKHHRKPKCLDGWDERYIQTKVTFRSNELKHIINSLDRNQMIITWMLFHGVNALTCPPQLMIDLLKASRITSLIMIDCEIPAIVAKWLERDFIPTLDRYYIGSSHNFIKHGGDSILRDDWLKAMLKRMHDNADNEDEFLSLGIPHPYCNLGFYEDQDEVTRRYIAHLIKIQKNAY